MSLLRRSQRRFRAVSELVSDYAYSFWVEPDGKLTAEWVTDALVSVTGYTVRELESLGGWEHLIHPDDLSIAERQLARLLSGEAYTVEYRIVTKSGEQRWTRDYARPEWDESEQRVVRIYGACQDITERRSAQEALRESKRELARQLAELNQIYSAAPLGLCLMDTDLRFVRINETLAAINGVPVSEHIGKSLWEILPSMAPDLEPIYRRVIETGQPALDIEVHGTTLTQPQIERDWLVSYYPITTNEGVILGVGNVVRDITQHKRAEEALRNSEELFRAISRVAPVGIYRSDADGNCTYARIGSIR